MLAVSGPFHILCQHVSQSWCRVNRPNSAAALLPNLAHDHMVERIGNAAPLSLQGRSFHVFMCAKCLIEYQTQR